MGEIQQVEPTALTGQAAEMEAQNWHNPAAEAVIPPDALPSTNDAIANLNANAQALLGYQQWAQAENTRIAEMLEIAAAAYSNVDEAYGKAIEDPDRQAAVQAIPIPAPSTPPPPNPSPPPRPRQLSAGGYADVRKTQADLIAGDQAASLKAAMLQWGLASTRVAENKPRPPSGDWEGDAADAAYTRLSTFGSWLEQLAQAWRDLAEAAAKIVEAHDAAKSEHTQIHSEYEALEKRLKELAAETAVGNSVAVANEMQRIQKRMEELQRQSDEVRQEYSNNATFSPVRPAEPPSGTADSATTAGGGGDVGGQPPGDPAALADRMSQSLGRSQSGAGSPAGASSGAGGPSGGGAPSGGESPSGSGVPGGTPGGVPGGTTPTGAPKLPTDPNLRPAALRGGGVGAGGGGGGGGGGLGVPSSPLSPAVTAETVAPAPVVPTASAATPGATTAGPVAAGAMGGMAPMHGAGAQQGKEKRRNPALAPDEDLYTEDRPWTEAVIGNRRRRDVQDGKEAK